MVNIEIKRDERYVKFLKSHPRELDEDVSHYRAEIAVLNSLKDRGLIKPEQWRYTAKSIRQSILTKFPLDEKKVKELIHLYNGAYPNLAIN